MIDSSILSRVEPFPSPLTSMNLKCLTLFRVALFRIVNTFCFVFQKILQHMFMTEEEFPISISDAELRDGVGRFYCFNMGL